MLLKLDMNFADYSGHPIRSCSVLKCHKREGDLIDFGDPLFDLKVSEISLPSHLGMAQVQTKSLHRLPGHVAELMAEQLEGKELEAAAPAPRNSRAQDRGFSSPQDWYIQIVAVDTGIVSEVYAEEGTIQNAGDPMALVATNERDANAAARAKLSEVPDFRAVRRSLALDLALIRSKSTDAVIVRQKGKKSIIFWSEPGERRYGIFAKGGCDLPSIFGCRPFIEAVMKGTCCITHEGSISDARNDLLLQTLRTDLPKDSINEVIEKLHIKPECFEPTIFQKTFSVERADGPKEFPLNVLILGNGSDLTRTLYRHREHGYLVDPGGGWLNEPLEYTLQDLSVVTWFRRNFVSVGLVTPEQYMENLSKVIQNVRRASGAHVMVFNSLTVDPNGTTHNYQYVKNPETTRRLKLKLALTKISKNLDVPVIDVDRIVKRAGVRTGRDMNHFHPKVTLMITEQIFGIMQDLAVFK